MAKQDKWDKPANCEVIPYTIGYGKLLFDEFIARGGEGVVCKDLDSPYVRGRSRYWIKCKATRVRTWLTSPGTLQERP